MTKPQLFASLIFRDFDGGADFLRAIGFVKVLIVRNDSDPARVEHSQFRWRDNGGLMAGSVRPDSPHAQASRVGTGSMYLVVDSDDEVDAIHARALAAGATSAQEPRDMEYGGRGSAVRDAEGNEWNFGSYAGE